MSDMKRPRLMRRTLAITRRARVMLKFTKRPDRTLGWMAWFAIFRIVGSSRMDNCQLIASRVVELIEEVSKRFGVPVNLIRESGVPGRAKPDESVEPPDRSVQ